MRKLFIMFALVIMVVGCGIPTETTLTSPKNWPTDYPTEVILECVLDSFQVLNLETFIVETYFSPTELPSNFLSVSRLLPPNTPKLFLYTQFETIFVCNMGESGVFNYEMWQISVELTGTEGVYYIINFMEPKSI